MRRNIFRYIKYLIGVFGLEIKRKEKIEEFPIELSKPEQELVKKIFDMKYTMTPINNLFATALACKYIIKNNIPGDFVECGTYRGGHALLATSLFNMYKQPRKVYMYDTFDGMTDPEGIDVEFNTGLAASEYFNLNKSSIKNSWCAASLEEVKTNFEKMHLLSKNVVFVKGDVGITLKENKNLPEQISILRLDTDWYKSTKIELETLYPRLVKTGILIIDDYGWWKGSKMAADEFFGDSVPFMSYIDQGARISVKN